MTAPIRPSAGGDVEAAEALALQGLGFLAEDPARMRRFLELTGLTRESLGALLGTRALLSAVLEHYARDESLLLVFAASRGVAPRSIGVALALLQEPRP